MVVKLFTQVLAVAKRTRVLKALKSSPGFAWKNAVAPLTDLMSLQSPGLDKAYVKKLAKKFTDDDAYEFDAVMVVKVTPALLKALLKRFPKEKALKSPTAYLLLDGNHRKAAAKLVGDPSIRLEVQTGMSVDEVLEFVEFGGEDDGF